jgi:hypothetical protein
VGRWPGRSGLALRLGCRGVHRFGHPQLGRKWKLPGWHYRSEQQRVPDGADDGRRRFGAMAL